MSRKAYYVLFIWHENTQTYLAHYGDYSQKVVADEIEWLREDEPLDWIKIVKTDGSVEDMVAKRDVLPTPRNPGKPAIESMS